MTLPSFQHLAEHHDFLVTSCSARTNSKISHRAWFAPDEYKSTSKNSCLSPYQRIFTSPVKLPACKASSSAGKAITYLELHEQVCRLANALNAHGVKKGDRVTIYLPMIPEAAYAMLACARIGAIHSVVFCSPQNFSGSFSDCSYIRW